MKRALRGLLRNPGFTVSVVLTLALTITANLTVMSMLSGTILRKPPVKDPDRVVVVTERRKADAQGGAGVRPSQYLAWRSSSAFDSSAVFRLDTASVLWNGGSERITLARVSPDFFKTLGIAPVWGKSFGENTEGQPIVLSHRLWLRDFGGNQDVLGKTIDSDGRAYTVIGVMPREFRVSLLDAEAWIPLPDEDWKSVRSDLPRLEVIARLARGVSAAQAEREITATSLSMPAELGHQEGDNRPRVLLLQDYIIETAHIKPIVSFLMGAILLVLLIACVNVSHLLFVRTSAKSSDLALQLALGAGMRHLTIGVVYESVLIAITSAAAGLLFTSWSLHVLQSYLTFNEYVSSIDLRIDGPTLWFGAGIILLVAIILSAIPVMSIRPISLDACLREQGRGLLNSRSKVRLGTALVIIQAAFASVLVVVTIAMLVKFAVAKHTSAGFNPSNVVIARMDLERQLFEEPSRRIQFVSTLLQNLRNQIGVESVAAATTLPMLGAESIQMDVGQQRPSWLPVKTRTVSAGFFQTLEIPLLRGIDFPESGQGSAHLVVVNRAFAKQFLGPHALDQIVRLRVGDDNSSVSQYRVIGIVGNTKHWLGEPGEVPEIYRMYADVPTSSLTVVMRSHLDKPGVVAYVRDAVRKLEPSQPVGVITTYRAALDKQQADDVLLNAILTFIALLAIILASLGIYGVLSHSIQTRQREFGLRLALGSTPIGLAFHVLKRSAGIAGSGAALGLILTPVLMRVLDSVFQGKVNHLATIVLFVFIVETASILLATWFPAWRAPRTNPVDLLRST